MCLPILNQAFEKKMSLKIKIIAISLHEALKIGFFI